MKVVCGICTLNVSSDLTLVSTDDFYIKNVRGRKEEKKKKKKETVCGLSISLGDE